jgi:putative Mg2+ transporter-C (MgtC) family protein
MDPQDLVVDDLMRMGAALIAGSLMGLERELRDNSVGFSTMVFICTGAALFTTLAHNRARDGDTARTAGTVVTGVGFLGAGAILRDGFRVAGLNTAATIWLTAAIGMTMGSGQYVFGTLVTAGTLLVLWVFPCIERAADRLIDENAYDLVFQANPQTLHRIDALFVESGMKVLFARRNRRAENFHVRWTVRGSRRTHEQLVSVLLADPSIKELSY